MRALLAAYEKRRLLIKKRLREFKKVYRRSDTDIFAELCFCLFTPQSKASFCDRAVQELKRARLLRSGSERDIQKILRGLVRFHNKKSSYLVAARALFTDGASFDVKKKFKRKDIFTLREWLVNNVKGLGCKEASHFLRNIGLGGDLAILDIHILRNLKRYGVITKIPLSMSKKHYMRIERKMRAFSKKIHIPLPEMDLLFWSNQTGFIFK